MNAMIAEEIATIGRAIGRAQAQLAEDEKAGYDVLAIDDQEEIAILHRIVRRLQRCALLPELP